MYPDLIQTFSSLGISLGLGLLVGLQREQAGTQLAGLRTFALITIFGTICGLLAMHFGGWVITAGLLALTGALLTGHVAELKGEKAESGVTTEVTALAMFSLGAYTVIGYTEAAIVMGGGIAVLLHFKEQLHGVASRLGADSKPIMQFALIAMVILPVLPNRTYGPLNVVNPRQIWMMVVLIVGIGLAGYITYKFFGEKAGLLLAGIAGGIISSTALTVSYAKRAAKQELEDTSAAAVILLASTASCVLVLVEIAVVAPRFVLSAIIPLAVLIMTLVAVSVPLWFLDKKGATGMPSQGNPTELKGALYFALLYTLILLAIAAVKDRYGAIGLYTVAGISGLAEVHALALSTARLVGTGQVDNTVGWRIIAVALISNLAFKFVILIVTGTRRLRREVGLRYLLAIAVGIGTVVAWPGAR